jgi:heme/copper-type cytochrome/quinol oxidase subunit 2
MRGNFPQQEQQEQYAQYAQCAQHADTSRDKRRGLQLDQAAESMMIGFAVLAVAVLLVLAPLYFCVFVCSRRQAKEEEEDSSEHQLAQLYVAH